MQRFVTLVEDMRAAQKRYFRTRVKVDLITAREAETRVDREIVDYRRGKLFDGTESQEHIDALRRSLREKNKRYGGT